MRIGMLWRVSSRPNPLQASGLHPALPACARRPAPIKHGRHMQFACPSRRPKLAVDDGGNDAQQRRIRLDDRCGFGGLDRPRGGIFESWLIFYETLHRASVVAVGKIPNGRYGAPRSALLLVWR